MTVRRTRVAAIAVIAAVALGACGGNGETAPSDTTVTTLTAVTAPTTALPPGVGPTRDVGGYQMTPIRPDQIEIPESVRSLGNLYTMLAFKDGAQVAFIVRGSLAEPPGTPKKAIAALDEVLQATGSGGADPPEVESVSVGGAQVQVVETPQGKTVAGTVAVDGAVALWIGPNRDAILDMLAALSTESAPETTAPSSSGPP